MKIDGRAIAARIQFETKERLGTLSLKPGLAIVQVGNDPASTLYVSLKERACQKLGIAFFSTQLIHDTDQNAVQEAIAAYNDDAAVHGIVLQLPLPAHLDADVALATIRFHKDVDGLSQAFQDALIVHEPTPWLPALMGSIIACCEETYIDFPASRFLLCAKNERFLAAFSAVLLFRNASVTTASTEEEMHASVADANVLVALLGNAHSIREAECSPGTIIIDCGITQKGDTVLGDFAGDEGLGRVRAYTPVPGGVGPVTVATLLANTVTAAQRT